MSIIKELENNVIEYVKEAGYDVESVSFQQSGRKDLGDYQINDAMILAKKYGENPRSIAEKIVSVLETKDCFENLNIAGPGFINFRLSEKFLTSSLNKIVNDISTNIDKKEYRKIIIDYGGANVSKALHVGHLRSANIGEALKRLGRILGYEMISDAHLGDYGRPLGLVILEIKKMYPNLAYFDEEYTGDYSEVALPITNSDLEVIYPQASIKAKEDEEYLEEARVITKKIQSHERGYYDLWKKVVSISKEEIKKVYDMLNVSFDLWQGESDAVEYLDELKKVFEEAGVLEESNGAMIVDVKTEEDKAPMPPLLFVKSNGSISYETTDLATILERKKNYNPDEIWYCVDARQELHFEQVFRAARKAKLIDDNLKLEFIGFGTMNGKDGKPFKTRAGGVMRLLNLIELVKDETRKRINIDIVGEDKKEETATIIAVSALKYADFLPYRTTDYVFDPAKFADLEGKTGPYLLYSTIRMKSLLTKAKDLPVSEASIIKNDTDKEVILTLLQFPNVLTKSLEVKSLNEIAEYLYKLSNVYNKFYAENRILTEENENLRASWLVLTKAVYDANCLLLEILGMKVPEKM